MSFSEYLREISGKGKIIGLAGVFMLIAASSIVYGTNLEYSRPELKGPLTQTIVYIGFISFGLAVILVGYYNWKYVEHG